MASVARSAPDRSPAACRGCREQALAGSFPDQLAVAAVHVRRRGDRRGVVAVQRGEPSRPRRHDLGERIVGDARIERRGPSPLGLELVEPALTRDRERAEEVKPGPQVGAVVADDRPSAPQPPQPLGADDEQQRRGVLDEPVGVAGGEAVGQVEQPAADVPPVAGCVEVGEVADDQMERQLVLSAGQCVVDGLRVPALLLEPPCGNPVDVGLASRGARSSRRRTSASSGW